MPYLVLLLCSLCLGYAQAFFHPGCATPKVSKGATGGGEVEGPPQRAIYTAMPMPMIVKQEAIKQALILSVVNPRIGGVLLDGRRGTCKTVLARSLKSIMPPIKRVKDSPYNIDPESNNVDSLLLEKLDAEGLTLSDVETEIVQAPFVELPLNAMEDRLVGSVDLERSLEEGHTVFSPGVLARAHRGVLYVDEINLLNAEVANILLATIAAGSVQVEREGISVTYPCKPLLVATYNPEEAELRPHLRDRFAISLSADEELLLDERVAAVAASLEWIETGRPTSEALAEEAALAQSVSTAIELLPSIKLAPEQVLYLCTEASRADCEGQRGELCAAQIARAHAALCGRNYVRAVDLKLAVSLSIAPRSRAYSGEESAGLPPDGDSSQRPRMAPLPATAAQDMDSQEEQNNDEDEENATEELEEGGEDEQPQEEEDTEDNVPAEFMFSPEGVVIDAELLETVEKLRRGKMGGKGALIFSQDRGRYIKAMFPHGKVTRIAVDATLRAAAPNQKGRRLSRGDGDDAGKKLYLDESDIRVKRLARKSGSLIIFVVDASGSMAMNRMEAAKGAALALLQHAYRRRDQAAVIVMQGEHAEVLLPPTKSVSMAQRRLEVLPCGGGTPLAHGLTLAVRTGINAKKRGDVGKGIIVLITDGRANILLEQSLRQAEEPETEVNGSGQEGNGNGNGLSGGKLGREEAKQEVLSICKQIASMPFFQVLVVSTEAQYVTMGAAEEMAQSCNGRYYYVPRPSVSSVAQVAQEAVAAMT